MSAALDWFRRNMTSILIIGFVFSVGLSAIGYIQNAQTLAKLDCANTYSANLVNTLRTRSTAGANAILGPHQFFTELADLLGHPDLTPTPKEQAANTKALLAANKVANKAYDAYLLVLAANPLPQPVGEGC